MYAQRIGPIVEDNVRVRDPLSEVGLTSHRARHGEHANKQSNMKEDEKNATDKTYLKRVYTQVDKRVQLLFIPSPGCRVSNVDDSQTRLPQIPPVETYIAEISPN